MGATESFWIGIAAGLAAAFLAWFFRQAVGAVITFLPVLGTRGVRGKWETTFEKGEKDVHEQATVHQLGKRVWGKLDYPEKGRVYRFQGSIEESVLAAVYERSGRGPVLDRGAFTLCLVPDGDRLKGTYSWLADQTHEVRSGPYEWRRIEST